ncbi:isopeptide-forming domain-containing fimbrial protein [Bifidobacterium saguini]|uniref:Isopeptide-forming domain-containing fimbrial protein n=2 Tax=Bifidobacterium saguini TaxID=762210 RepID=A0ABX7SBK2_9BIFI|nr:SpaA isopeptide-forming pilin-related protein [Bifidobacterium saguini]QTB90707.1 isopeptide-forming domain-containing fimbrial protein [Bifidobacterium saguini]
MNKNHEHGNNIRRAAALSLAAATLVAGLATAPAAMAADGNLTITAGAGGSLAGHSFDIYQLATYPDVQLDGDEVKNVSAKPTGESDAWIKTALDAAGVSVDSSAGENTASQLLRQTTGSVESRKIAASLQDNASGKTAVKKNLTSGESTLTVSLPEGFYLITDSAGLPILVSTTVSGKTSMGGATLGTTYIKSRVAQPDKQVKSIDGTWKESAAATNGETREFRIRLTLPNSLSADTITIDDGMEGMQYVDGSFAATISEGDGKGADVTSMFSAPGSSDSGKGFKTTSTGDLIDGYQNQQVTVTYKARITDADKANAASNTAKVTVNWLPDAVPPTITPPEPGEDTVTVPTYDVDLKKISAASTDTNQIAVSGAKFTIKNETLGKWLNWDEATRQWSYVDTAAAAQERSTDAKGVISYDSLGAGTYLISETQTPAGYLSFVKPSFRVTIDDEGKTSITGVEQAGLTSKVADADGKATTPTATVKNLDSVTQLPQTGGASMAVILIGGMAVLLFAGATGIKAFKLRRIGLFDDNLPQIMA